MQSFSKRGYFAHSVWSIREFNSLQEYSSYLGVDSKQNLGVIVLANQGIAQATTELGTELMRLIRSETRSPATG